MASIYTTSDFFRDNYWLYDRFLVLLSKIRKSVKKLFRSLMNLELESYFLRIIENLPYGIMIVFLGFFLTVFLLRTTETEYGMQVFRITTASMSPTVKPGSLLFSYPAKVYKVGDIVSYKEKNLNTDLETGRILTHRVIDRKVVDGFYVFTLKGDSNKNPDPDNVRTTDIIGRVFFIVPYMGYIDFLITTLPGFIIFIAVPSILLIIEARKYLLSKD